LIPDSAPRLIGWTSSKRDLLVVPAVAVAAHGLLLTNNGIAWDDWLNYTHARNGEFSVLCEATLVVTQGPEKQGAIGLVTRYIYYSLFDIKQRAVFLRGVTNVQVTPHPSSQAVNCSSG
jgi:hypothetical protein